MLLFFAVCILSSVFFSRCFFLCFYLIVSILYQRGIYDPESFTKVQKYGLGMQVTTDTGLSEYLRKVLLQMEGNKQQNG